jgi:hypothetical protein
MTIRNTQVQTIPTQIFLAEGQQAVTTMMFCNVTTQTATLNVFAVPFGGNPGNSTIILNGITIPAGESFALDSERFVLEENDAFFAQASGNNTITATVSSVSTE